MSGHIKSKLSNTRIIIIYYIVIGILTIYATYKNGIMLYQKHLINILGIFKPLLLVLLSIALAYIVNYLFHIFIRKDNYSFKDDYTPVLMTLITLTLPLNINVIIFVIIMITVNIIKHLFKIEFLNYYNLSKIIVVLLLLIISKYSYLTLYDTNIETNFSTFDLFLGRGVGGLATSNILLLIFCYFILLFNDAYKKEIPIIAIISYIITLVLFDLIAKNNIILDIKSLITNGFTFGCIFIATIPMYSPIKYKNIVIYSILIGIISFIINKIFIFYDSVYIAILIVNIVIFVYELLERKILNEHK